MFFKVKGDANAVGLSGQVKKRLSGFLRGIKADDVSIVGQTVQIDTNGNVSAITAFTGANTHSGTETFSNATGVTTDTITARSASFVTSSKALVEKRTASAINATATATAAEVATGYITSTSAAATAITLPTGTLLGGALGAAAGTSHELIIDNTAGANTVTIAVAVNGILSAAAAAVGASFGLLTVPSGVTGMARFTILFSSATAYTITRTA